MIHKIFDIKDLNDDLIAKYFPILSDARQKKIASMKSVEDRTIAFCTEIIARKCLSEHCNAPEFSFSLLCLPNGKTVVGNYDVNISMTICDDLIGCAVSDKNIGIGIHKIYPFTFKEAQELFSDSEIRNIFSVSKYSFSEIVNLNECNETEVMQKFAVFSSLKEAYFQASGRSIRSDMHKIDFVFDGSELICSDKDAAVSVIYIDKKRNIAVSVIERK